MPIPTFVNYVDDNDDEEDDSDYEVDYTGMNVSPEILRMLGARYQL